MGVGDEETKGFEDTDNKRCVRRQYDLPIIRKFRERKRRKLFYFGLTGPEMHDIDDWKQFLERDVMSAEEVEDFDLKVGRMNSVGDGLGFQVRVLRGKIENAMLTGRDLDGEAPLRSRQGPDGYLFFDYDLVNLDFDGGMFYDRMEAIPEFLKRQSQVESLLLITFNVRHGVHNALDQGLIDLRARLGGTREAEAILAWYKAQPQTYRIKAIVPGVITAAANQVKLDCFAYPPVIYDGKQAKMVHFVFHLTPHTEVLRGFANQSEQALLGLPIIYVSKAVLELDQRQAPDFDAATAKDSLGFLGANRADAIISQYQSKSGVVKAPSSRPRKAQ